LQMAITANRGVARREGERFFFATTHSIRQKVVAEVLRAQFFMKRYTLGACQATQQPLIHRIFNNFRSV